MLGVFIAEWKIICHGLGIIYKTQEGMKLKDGL
jgi:hypothetical protein